MQGVRAAVAAGEREAPGRLSPAAGKQANPEKMRAQQRRYWERKRDDPEYLERNEPTPAAAIVSDERKTLRTWSGVERATVATGSGSAPDSPSKRTSSRVRRSEALERCPPQLVAVAYKGRCAPL